MDDIIEAIIEVAGDILEAFISHKREKDPDRIRIAWHRMTSAQKWSAAFFCPLFLILGAACVLYVLLAPTDSSTRLWGVIAGVMLIALCVILTVRCFRRHE